MTNCIRCNARPPSKANKFRGIAYWVTDIDPRTGVYEPLPMMCPDCLSPDGLQMSLLPRARKA
jgi:hypothetical protein